MTNIPSVEERVEEFAEYMGDGYSGGKKGLRCTECDGKYRGDSALIQLCPKCRARQALTAAREAGARDEREQIIKELKIVSLIYPKNSILVLKSILTAEELKALTPPTK